MRRSGVTLVETLVAIFVMALGMLALLALFPVGAISMAQAIAHDRATHSALNGNAVVDIWKLRDAANMIPAEPSAYTSPGTLPPLVSPPYTGPGYPVFIDPIGF